VIQPSSPRREVRWLRYFGKGQLADSERQPESWRAPSGEDKLDDNAMGNRNLVAGRVARVSHLDLANPARICRHQGPVGGGRSPLRVPPRTMVRPSGLIDCTVHGSSPGGLRHTPDATTSKAPRSRPHRRNAAYGRRGERTLTGRVSRHGTRSGGRRDRTPREVTWITLRLAALTASRSQRQLDRGRPCRCGRGRTLVST